MVFAEGHVVLTIRDPACFLGEAAMKVFSFGNQRCSVMEYRLFRTKKSPRGAGRENELRLEERKNEPPFPERTSVPWARWIGPDRRRSGTHLQPEHYGDR